MTHIERATEFVKRYPNLFTEDQEWWAQQIEALLAASESKHAEEMKDIDEALNGFRDMSTSRANNIIRLCQSLSSLSQEREKELREAIAFGRDWEIYAPHDRIADTDEEVFAAFLKTKEGK
jgi:hypothetical protein